MRPVIVEKGPGFDLAPQALVGRPGQLLGAPDEGLELILHGVVEFQAALVEHLQAVVAGRVVRGRDHDAGREPAGAGQEGQCGRGQHARTVDVRAHRRRAGDQGGRQHVAGAPRVLADHDGASGRHQAAHRRASQGVRQRGPQVHVGHPPDAIGAKETGHPSGGRGRRVDAHGDRHGRQGDAHQRCAAGRGETAVTAASGPRFSRRASRSVAPSMPARVGRVPPSVIRTLGEASW